ncbi:hypothetical protein BG004_000089 [Podila humilis]|nr:hypothetical protein BG004_000089 [Podila humilis]
MTEKDELVLPFTVHELESKLLTLQCGQRESESPSRHRSNGISPILIDNHLQQLTHETVTEILGRLHRQKEDLSLLEDLEGDSASQQQQQQQQQPKRTHPALVKSLDIHSVVLHQSHGNANLQHRAAANG